MQVFSAQGVTQGMRHLGKETEGMTNIICTMEDCVHRSTRPMRNLSDATGRPYYACQRRYVVISQVSDPDGDIEATAGIENMAHCACFAPKLAAQEG